jgi:hypothetical protein
VTWKKLKGKQEEAFNPRFCFFFLFCLQEEEVGTGVYHGQFE